MSTLTRELKLARRCAKEAGALVLKYFRNPTLSVEMKADDTPVSAADRAAEAYIRPLIKETFPEDAIYGEEEGLQPGSSGRTWYIDPIDGTKAFIRGLPYFGVLVGLADRDTPIVGAVAAPALAGEPLWSGAVGEGADRDGKEICVSDTETLAKAFFIISPPALQAPEDAKTLRPIIEKSYHQAGFLDVLAYVDLAAGGHDFVISKGEKPWDICAPAAIIRAAGGKCTSFSGGSCLTSENILACNANLYAEVQADLYSRRA